MPVNREHNNANSIAIIDEAITGLQEGNDEAHWSDEVIEAARELLRADPRLFQRKRAAIKKAGKKPQITAWTNEVKAGMEGQQQDTKADALVSAVRKRAELFHDPERNCYANFQEDEHFETWALGSRGFADWMGYLAYRELGFAPSEATAASAISTLNGIALYEGQEIPVYLRCAPIDGGYMVDLTDTTWRAVEVKADGWRIVDRPKVRFVRSKTAAPFPFPDRDGNVESLWAHVNIPHRYRPLVAACLLEFWRPETPYPVLELCGEQGCAKSSTHKRLRQLTDPNTVPLRAAPKTREDIFVAAGNNHQASFENMSGLSAAMQDALCTLATGGGFAARKLYSDADENVISVKRPVIANGIQPIATRPDLIDRTIHIDLPRIDVYRPESELDAEFADGYPKIFGGLLTLFSRTLAALPKVSIERPPRMADFAGLGQAMLEAVNGSRDGCEGFVGLLRENRNASLRRSLDASPAVLAVMALANTEGHWEGTMKELKHRLDISYRQEGEGWPRSPEGLSHALRRLAPALRELGVEVERTGHSRTGNTVRISSSNADKQDNPSTHSHLHDNSRSREGLKDVKVDSNPSGSEKKITQIDSFDDVEVI